MDDYPDRCRIGVREVGSERSSDDEKGGVTAKPTMIASAAAESSYERSSAMPKAAASPFTAVLGLSMSWAPPRPKIPSS
jgi:hypothetical protein